MENKQVRKNRIFLEEDQNESPQQDLIAEIAEAMAMPDNSSDSSDAEMMRPLDLVPTLAIRPPSAPREAPSVPAPLQQRQPAVVGPILNLPTSSRSRPLNTVATPSAATVARFQPKVEEPPKSSSLTPKAELAERQAQFFCVMNAMRQNGEMCDMTLLVENSEVKVHRVVISACSCYFRAMFTSNMTEALSDKVKLQDVSFGTVRAIVDFAYTADIELNDDNVQDLLSAANRYQIEPIKDACSNYLKKQLNAANCLGIRNFAEFHNCIDLFSAAEQFADTHFEEVYQQEEFVALDSAAVIALLKRSEITVSSEDEIYKAAIRWIRSNQDEGIKHKQELFAAVRFPLLTRRFLTNEIKEESLLQDCCQCLKFILDGMQYHLMDTEEKATISDLSVQPRQRKYNFKIAVIGGNEIQCCQYFDPFKLSWSDFPIMTEKRKDHCMAKVNNCIYVLGGSSLFLHTRIDCFNILTQKWKMMDTRLEMGRDCAAACVVASYVYITGGTRNHGAIALNSSHCFQPELERMVGLPPLLQERYEHGMVHCKGCLYVCGGAQNGGTELRHCEKYTISTNRWTKISPMNCARKGPGLAAVAGKIYAIGGQSDKGAQDTVEKFDPVLGTWTFKAKMPYKLRHVKCAVIEDSIWVVGGLKDVGRLTNVLEYRPLEDRWIFHHNTKSCIYGNAAVCTVDICVTDSS